jgi:hypothetical protein
MTEFKIQLEDSLVQQFGYKEIDDYLKKLVKKTTFKNDCTINSTRFVGNRFGK